MNYIEEYYNQIKDNKIKVSYEVRKTYEHIYKKLTDTSDGFHFDIKKADRVIKFIETFCHAPKVRGNPLLNLMLWQKAMLQTIFGFVDDNGYRQYQEVLLLVARKQGKSSLGGALGHYLLIADGEAQPEILCAATKKEQAKILWQAGVDMLGKSPDLQEIEKKHVSDIVCEYNGGIWKPLASESNSLDGLNASSIFLDEIHAYKDSSLYDVLIDSTANRKQPLTISLTTAGFVRNGFYDQQMNLYQQLIDGYSNPDGAKDPRRIAFIYKLDSEQELNDETAWVKANPGLGIIRSYEKLKEDVERLKYAPEKKKDILTKFFNMPQTGSVQTFWTLEQVTNTEEFNILNLEHNYSIPAIGGFDLSRIGDLTAASIVYMLNDDTRIHTLNCAFIPENKLEDKIKKDSAPYDIWIKKGYMRVCAGDEINYHDIKNWFIEMQEKYNLIYYKIGYDRWSANYLVEDMQNTYGKAVMQDVAMGPKTLSIPLQKLHSEIINKNVIYNNNPVMRWCLANTMVQQDANGNYMLAKDRKKANMRDDMAVSLLIAYTVLLQEYENYNNLVYNMCSMDLNRFNY